MKARKFPTFGQLGRYLKGLGFTHRRREDDGDPVHVYEHAESGCKFILPHRPSGEMVRGGEVLNIHYQLWWRSLIPDEVDIYQFLADFVAAGKSGKAG